MGANDNCDSCGQPLDFFDYYIIVTKKMNGPEEVRAIAKRYCDTCITFYSPEASLIK